MAGDELQDQALTCGDCGMQFTFTIREQAFYKDRGFVPPRRCRTCRDKRKSSPQGVPKLNANSAETGNATGATGQADGRDYYKIVCASCGVETTVPFKPDPQRPAFCRKCYVGRRRQAPGQPNEQSAGSGS
jgi:CxxC-x17-CxxC domain-containing protein